MIWIIGKTYSDLPAYLAKHALPYGIIWDRSLAKKPPSSVPVIPVDFNQNMVRASQLQHLVHDTAPIVIVGGYENYVLHAARIAHLLKIPGMTLAAAEAVTNKTLMREKFQAFDQAITPDYAAIREKKDIDIFTKHHKFPLVLKPAHLMKSLLVSKNNTYAELLENYAIIQHELQATYKRYGIYKQPQLLLEEFLEGSMHTVAAFVDQKGEISIVPGIVDCVTAYEMQKNDSYIFSRQTPSRLSSSDQAAIIAVAKRGITALGLTSTAAHVEIMLTKEGPKIIEIGARIGGYRPRMYQESVNIDMYGALIKTAQGQKPTFNMNTAPLHHVAVIELFPEEEGTFRALDNAERIQELPSAIHMSIKVKSGQQIGRSSHGYKASAIVMLRHRNWQQLTEDYEYIKHHGHIQLNS